MASPVVIAPGDKANTQRFMDASAKALEANAGLHFDKAMKTTNDFGPAGPIKPVKTGILAKLWPNSNTYHRLYKADDLTLYNAIPDKDIDGDENITKEERANYTDQTRKIKEIVKSSYIASAYSYIYRWSIVLIIVFLIHASLVIWGNMALTGVGGIMFLVMEGLILIVLGYYGFYKVKNDAGEGEARIDNFESRLAKLKSTGATNSSISQILLQEHNNKRIFESNNNNYNNNYNNNGMSSGGVMASSAIGSFAGNMIADIF